MKSTVKEPTIITIREALELIKAEKLRSIGIATEFGVADITKKEALRLIETCELDMVHVSYSLHQVILEY